MSSVKIILRTKLSKDGTQALALQIIKDRKKSIIHVGHCHPKTLLAVQRK